MKFHSASVSLLLTATSFAKASIYSKWNNHPIAKAASYHGSTTAATVKSSHFGIVENSLKPAFHLVPRGGASLENSDEEGDNENSNNNNTDDVPPTLYLPGLVDAKVAKKNVSKEGLYVCRCFVYLFRRKPVILTPTNINIFLKATKDATTDSTVILSSKKAKELSIKEGDIIGVIGRRRRATYAIATIQKAPKGVVSLSYNLANNLRVREGDKVKIVKIGVSDAEEKEERSGDMELLTQDAPIVSSVTYAPIEDSLNSLIASEGGDEIEDEELMDRFLTPYLNLEDGVKVIAKEGNVLTIRDENGKSLDFMVSHVDDGEESEGMSANESFLVFTLESFVIFKYIFQRLTFSSQFPIFTLKYI